MRSLSERRWASSSAFPTIYHHITHQNNSLGIFTHLCTWESYHVVVSTGSCCADEVLGYDTIRTYVWCQLSTLTKEHSGRRGGGDTGREPMGNTVWHTRSSRLSLLSVACLGSPR